MQQNHIREIRAKAGITVQQLADRLDTTAHQIYRLETYQRRMTADWMLRIADALGCDPLELLGERQPRFNNATLLGHVGADERYIPFEKPGTIALPSRVDGLVAIEVRGNGLWPRYEHGDVLLYKPRQTVEESECVGRYCVAATRAGSVYVKRLLRGACPGRYRLTSIREPDIDDVEVIWSSPISCVISPGSRP